MSDNAQFLSLGNEPWPATSLLSSRWPSGVREVVAVILLMALVFQARLWCSHDESGLCVPDITRRTGFGYRCVCHGFALPAPQQLVGCGRGTGVGLFAVEESRHGNEMSDGEPDLVCAHLCVWHGKNLD